MTNQLTGEEKKELKKRLWQYENRIDADDDAWKIYWKGEWEGFIESILTRHQKEVVKKIRNNLVQFAFEGRFEKDEMKGLVLYTKIIKYFDSLNKENI